MKLRQQARRALAVAVVMFMMFGTQAFAAGHEDDVDVFVSTIQGERQLDVLSAGLGTLNSLSVAEHSTDAPFATRVTDTLYDHVGYTVSATLSNLFQYDIGADSFTCGEFIEASNLSIGFAATVPNPSDLAAQAQPIFDFVTDSDIALPGITDQVVEVKGVVGVLQEYAEGDIDTILDELPIGVAHAGGGSFAEPDTHACDGNDGAPAVNPDNTVSVQIQTGTARDPFESAVEGDLSWDTIDSHTAAINEGLLTETALDDAITDALIALGVDPVLTEGLLGTVKADLDLDAKVLQLRQTGTYLALPKLMLGESLTGNVVTGTYKGTMTITLVDD